MKHLNSTCRIALFTFLGGVFANTIFFAVVNASEIVLFEDGFTPTQGEAQSPFIMSESGFEDIQDTSEGKEPTPTPVVVLATSTPIPNPVQPPAIGTSTPSRGGGGSNPLVVQNLLNETTSGGGQTHASPTQESTTENTSSENTGTHNGVNKENTHENNSDSNSAEILLTESDSINNDTIDLLEDYHSQHAGKEENKNFIQKAPKAVDDFDDQDGNTAITTNEINEKNANILFADDDFFQGSIHNTSSKNILGGERKGNEEVLENSTCTVPDSLQSFHGVSDEEESESNKQKAAETIFCSTHGFHFLLLFILFLCGMITEYILIKIFYNNKNDNK